MSVMGKAKMSVQVNSSGVVGCSGRTAGLGLLRAYGYDLATNREWGSGCGTPGGGSSRGVLAQRWLLAAWCCCEEGEAGLRVNPCVCKRLCLCGAMGKP